MRARDVQAVVFAVVSTCVIMIFSYAMLQTFLVTAAFTGSYLIWLLTRPRMMRLMRRARGAPDWSGYFRNS